MTNEHLELTPNTSLSEKIRPENPLSLQYGEAKPLVNILLKKPIPEDLSVFCVGLFPPAKQDDVQTLLDDWNLALEKPEFDRTTRKKHFQELSELLIGNNLNTEEEKEDYKPLKKSMRTELTTLAMQAIPEFTSSNKRISLMQKIQEWI